MASAKRKAAPLVKQNKASAYRILKANPLLMHDKESMEKLGLKNQNEVPQAVDVLGIASEKKCQRFNEGAKTKLKNLQNTVKASVDITRSGAGACLQKTRPRLSITAMYKSRLRRSRSAEKFDPIRCIERTIFEEAAAVPEISRSLEDISINTGNLSPIVRKLKVAFTTTPVKSRRSQIHRALAPQKYTSTPAPSTFGASHSLYMEIEDNDMEFTEELDSDVGAKNALRNLKKAIEMGHPPEQCEARLGSIRRIYLQIEDDPVYWECRASLEQSRGNISSAVEHYRKPIVEGAEVQTVAESLDRLLQTFNLFNVNAEEKMDNMEHIRIMLDARNAFKSTVIQLALRERDSKRKRQATEAGGPTPRRNRSTRISFVHY